MQDNKEPEVKSSANSVARPPVETLNFKREPEAKYWAAAGEFWSLLRELAKARGGWRLFLPYGIILLLLCGNVTMSVLLNDWNGPFFRSIEKKDLVSVGWDLVRFCQIVGVLMLLVVTQTWVQLRWKISLRRWLTNYLLDRWLVSGRAYRLAISSDDAVNPDQRMQEDVRNLCEISIDLAIGILHSTLMTLSFIGVLWGLSRGVQFSWNEKTFQIPGYMVWVAILYAVVGSWLTAKVGRPLIDLNEERYTREANFRFSMVRVNESAESIALINGEDDERKIIDLNFNHVLKVMLRTSSAVARLTWITSGYNWMTTVIPVLSAMPGYMQGTLDWGGVMVVVGAFNQVQGSLRWFVDNYQKIADGRTALHRVSVFREAVEVVDELENNDQKIKLLPHPEGHLSFEGVKISLIDGEVVIADATAHIRPAERVLITGESGSGKSTLFRAVGGLWPWGGGTIKLPPRSEVMFLPQKPYMPLGTLANSIAYPKAAAVSDREAMKRALERVNLKDFTELLDVEDRWDRLMSLGQQQRLAFARLLIHRPKWVFLDEATSAMDDENQHLVMSLFLDDLKDTTVLSIGHRPNLVEYHTRTLQLSMTSAGTILRRKPFNPPKARLLTRTARFLLRKRRDQR